jgi:hypothetical protein
MVAVVGVGLFHKHNRYDQVDWVVALDDDASRNE